MVWKVESTPEVDKEITKLRVSGELSHDDLIVISTWVKEMELYGPKHFDQKHWNDHALDGKWRGYRSSSFSFKGRIIYKVKNEIVTVQAVRITPDHNYK